MKLNIGKTLFKALEAGAGAAAGTVAAASTVGVSLDPKTTGIIAAVAALLRAIVNIIKTLRKPSDGRE